MTLSGKAKLAGVMGWPVSHSRSPRLHGYWLQSLGIDGAYVPLAVSPDNLADAIKALPKLGFRGVNLTVPHKEAVIELLDAVEPQAKRIGAVNTVVVREDGSLYGKNTDAFGFYENLRQGAPHWQPGQGPALVLGAGGAARAVVAALIEAGVPDIRLANRNLDRARQLAADLGGPITPIAWDQRSDALAGAALLVNTTTLGMEGQPPLEIDLGALPTDAVVNDIVYVPLETDLLARARARGNAVVDGLGMLLWQAVPGFEAWFGATPQVTPALRDFVLGKG
jgi:shikimate dehydrogenase